MRVYIYQALLDLDRILGPLFIYRRSNLMYTFTLWKLSRNVKTLIHLSQENLLKAKKIMISIGCTYFSDCKCVCMLRTVTLVSSASLVNHHTSIPHTSSIITVYMILHMF